jgi:hypothetical protein
MPSVEQQEINRLCLAVIAEKDPAKLTELVAELSELLQRREQRVAQANVAAHG